MDKVFIEGMYYNKPHPEAPEFVLGGIAIKKEQFLPFLDKLEPNDKGYVRIDFKQSKGGKQYCELNTYKADEPQNKKTHTDEQGASIKDMPF